MGSSPAKSPASGRSGIASRRRGRRSRRSSTRCSSGGWIMRWDPRAGGKRFIPGGRWTRSCDTSGTADRAARVARPGYFASAAIAWCKRPDGSNEFVNQRWQDYTGIPEDEARGQGWQAAVHPDDLPKLTEKWAEMVASGSSYVTGIESFVDGGVAQV